MKNKWNYSGQGQVRYGSEDTYRPACRWLDDACQTVEDWGCGCAYAKRFFKAAKYQGIDGSSNQFADRTGIDLAEYKSECDGILMRHVLDHNVNWEPILVNALKSFNIRMSLVFFRKFGPVTKVLSVSDSPLYPGVPDVQFCESDFLPFIGHFLDHKDVIVVDEAAGLVDTIYFLKK